VEAVFEHVPAATRGSLWARLTWLVLRPDQTTGGI
jgi:hypothetical protein